MKIIYGTYTAKQLADQNCRCTRCEDAKRAELLEAVKRAIADFEPNEKSRVCLRDSLRSLLKHNAKPKEVPSWI